MDNFGCIFVRFSFAPQVNLERFRIDERSHVKKKTSLLKKLAFVFREMFSRLFVHLPASFYWVHFEHEISRFKIVLFFVHCALNVVLLFVRSSTAFERVIFSARASFQAVRRRVKDQESNVCKHPQMFVHLPVIFYFALGYIMNIKLAAFKLLG